MSDELEKPSSTIAPEGSLERKLDDALNACVPDFLDKVDGISGLIWMHTDENKELLTEGKLRHSRSSIECETVAHAIGNMTYTLGVWCDLAKRKDVSQRDVFIVEKVLPVIEGVIPKLCGYFEDEKYEAIHDQGMAFIEQLEEIQGMLQSAQSTDKSKGSSNQR